MKTGTSFLAALLQTESPMAAVGGTHASPLGIYLK
jgi:hypothetical protein